MISSFEEHFPLTHAAGWWDLMAALATAAINLILAVIFTSIAFVLLIVLYSILAELILESTSLDEEIEDANHRQKEGIFVLFILTSLILASISMSALGRGSALSAWAPLEVQHVNCTVYECKRFTMSGNIGPQNQIEFEVKVQCKTHSHEFLNDSMTSARSNKTLSCPPEWIGLSFLGRRISPPWRELARVRSEAFGDFCRRWIPPLSLYLLLAGFILGIIWWKLKRTRRRLPLSIQDRHTIVLPAEKDTTLV